MNDSEQHKNGETYFGDIKLQSTNESSNNKCTYEHEFERFVQSKNTKTHVQEFKNCSQLGIMQPLEQLHTANLALGIKLELFFENIFRVWGTFVARNPWSIIIASIIISVYLASGVFFNFQVTTDPVDLWVPLGSEARNDMEYFNEKFWKFYRIEHILIEPRNIDFFMSRDFTSKNSDSQILFGPVFNQTFLLEAFDLYRNILAIGMDGNINITLDNICYKPMGGYCATQSIFTYFHDDINRIQSENYLKQIQDCVEYAFY